MVWCGVVWCGVVQCSGLYRIQTFELSPPSAGESSSSAIRFRFFFAFAAAASPPPPPPPSLDSKYGLFCGLAPAGAGFALAAAAAAGLVAAAGGAVGLAVAGAGAGGLAAAGLATAGLVAAAAPVGAAGFFWKKLAIDMFDLFLRQTRSKPAVRAGKSAADVSMTFFCKNCTLHDHQSIF